MKINKLSLLKALSYRTIGTLATFTVSYFFTKDISVSLGIASLEFVGKIVLYYIHDRLWEKFK